MGKNAMTLALIVFASIIGYAIAPLVWMAAAWALEWVLERFGK